jgi:hypothetical protein
MSIGYAGTPVSTAICRVRCLPEPMNMKLVEPLRELFKDEVRIACTKAGLLRAQSRRSEGRFIRPKPDRQFFRSEGSSPRPAWG